MIKRELRIENEELANEWITGPRSSPFGFVVLERFGKLSVTHCLPSRAPPLAGVEIQGK